MKVHNETFKLSRPEIKAILEMVETIPDRPDLIHALFDPQRRIIVAIDGRCALHMRDELGEPQSTKGLPFMVARGALEQIAKAMPSRGANHCYISLHPEKSQIQVRIRNSKKDVDLSDLTLPARLDTKSYPDVESLIPKRRARNGIKSHIAFDARLLSKLAVVQRAAETSHVCLQMPLEEFAPAMARIFSEEPGTVITVLVMPFTADARAAFADLDR